MDAEVREAEEALLKLGSAFLRNSMGAMELSVGVVQTQAQAKHKFRSRSGMAERSIETGVSQNEQTTEGVIEINSGTAPYAIYQHEGTGLYGPNHARYPIVPRNKKSLRFLGRNGFVFAQKVMHPGIQGDPFVYNAAEAKMNEVAELFERAFARTVKEAGLE